MQIVFYTGIGANKNGLHTVDEFIKIVQRVSKKLDKSLDVDHTKYKLKDWIMWAGATLVTTRKV